MQMAKSSFVALAALALLAVPALGKNTKAQEPETEDASPSCHSYQLGPDGNWVPLPCRELGTPSPPQHRAPSRAHTGESR